MSAVLAILGPSVPAQDEASVMRLLATMARRGAEERSVWRSERAVLASARDRWEMDEGFAGPTMVASREGCHVVCDATLYYTRDLRDRLEAAGTIPASDAAGDLILAAYLCFGVHCVDHLEGDFAFCVWDERSDTLFCARDPFGTRSLYHMEWDGGLMVASTAHPLVRSQGSRAEYDEIGVLRSLLMRPGDGTVTAWRGILELPAAHTLVASAGSVRVSRYWRAAPSERWQALSSAEAVRVAADLLNDASLERRGPDGTALAMSGGQDSTSILASLYPSGPDGGQAPVHVLSFKLPEGDPGNEDWYVNRAADAFRVPVHWVRTEGRGFFENVDERSTLRSHCHGHAFELHNRALAEAARGLGIRVLLNGHGGDNLFGVGDWAMADLLRTGRWRQLRRYFTARGYRGASQFLSYCFRPALPLRVFDHLETVLGRQICSRPWERPIPPWIAADESLVKQIAREDREAYRVSVVRNEATVAGRQRSWALMDSTFRRGCAALFDLKRDEGVELRMPFYDRRLVEFVMSRPADEFNQPGQYKVLLRRAMEGRLPDRTREAQAGGLKSGTAVGVLETHWKPQVEAFTEQVATRPWIAEQLGLVDARDFVQRVRLGKMDHWLWAVDVNITLFAEAWLRAHDSSAASGVPASTEARAERVVG